MWLSFLTKGSVVDHRSAEETEMSIFTYASALACSGVLKKNMMMIHLNATSPTPSLSFALLWLNLYFVRARKFTREHCRPNLKKQSRVDPEHDIFPAVLVILHSKKCRSVIGNINLSLKQIWTLLLCLESSWYGGKFADQSGISRIRKGLFPNTDKLAESWWREEASHPQSVSQFGTCVKTSQAFIT